MSTRCSGFIFLFYHLLSIRDRAEESFSTTTKAWSGEERGWDRERAWTLGINIAYLSSSLFLNLAGRWSPGQSVPTIH